MASADRGLPRTIRRFGALVLVLLASCGTAKPGPGSSTEPSPTAGPLGRIQAKLALIDHVGDDFLYCDPDSFPVAHGTELQNARERQKDLEADPAYRLLLDHLDLPAHAELTDDQLVAVYRLYKKLAFVDLQRIDNGYEFAIHLESETRTGTISDDGSIEERAPSPNGAGCPICLARNTRIASPNGPVSVQDVRVGMAVWSTDGAGHRIHAVVLRIGRTPVPLTHEVVQLVLADGRIVLVSPGHPTPGGRIVGDLWAGARFDGSSVVSARRVPYAGEFTFDLLPSGPTGTYFANRVLLGSTLAWARDAGRTMAAK
jgi:hypothetical protein